MVESIGGMKTLSSEARAAGKTVVLVPTMGYLHRAHMGLVEKAKTLGDLVVVSIMINPAQFGPKEDFKAYPRDLERDLEMLGEAGVDVVFTPSAREMYPAGYQTFVDVVKLDGHLCGPRRPGHFRGVATVVTKFFNIVRPCAADFGLKDYQQCLIIERLVEDLNMDVELHFGETVREADGLAMSSRNVHLDNEHREAAGVIPRSLEAAGEAFAAGERDGRKLSEMVKNMIEKEPLAVIDYVSVCGLDDLRDLDRIDGGALLAVAVRVGETRLIDNRILDQERGG
ncbi:MAG: pantoate--beta-alanine ligase [Thermodesulfobacteriota bacterium]